MKKKKIEELSDEELKSLYKRYKKGRIATLVTVPIGGFIVGLVSGKSISAFVPATVAYTALCGVCSYKVSKTYYNSMEELNKRDTTRRFLFEDFKKSKMSKKEIENHKKYLEQLIEHKNTLNEYYSVLELENDLLLYKGNDPKEIYKKVEENKAERKRLEGLVEKTDKLIDDFIFLLSDEKEYLESIKIPRVGIDRTKYSANSFAIDNQTTFFQRPVDKSVFDKAIKDMQDVIKQVDDFIKDQSEVNQTNNDSNQEK